MTAAMPISQFFAELGFPLHNVRWSWGARSEQGILLRAWADELRYTQRCIRVLGTPEVIRQVDRNGLLERVNHLQALWNSGIAGYVAVVTAKDVHATPRVISDYRRDIVFAIEHLQQNPDASIDAVFAREPIPVATLHQHAAGHRTVANSDAFPLIEIPASPR